MSIDGGGIRGIIPAVLLTEIEKRSGKHICELFDLIAGTSAGGLLTLRLTKPGKDNKPQYKASDLVNLFQKRGRTIFSKSISRKILSLGSLIEEKYPTEPLEKVFQEYFGETMLSDVLTPVIVTAYEIERRVAFFFKSKNANTKNAYNYSLKDVARATSAAPTYFEPAKIETKDHTEYFALIDGGVFANNPAMCAYVEAKSMFPDANIILVSLGTGKLSKTINYNKAAGWGLAQWARPILDVVFDGIDDTVDYQLRNLLPDSPDLQQYYRFQAILTAENTSFDNVSEENIRYLKLAGEDIIRENAKELNSLIKQITQ